MKRNRWLTMVSIVLALSFVLSACAPAATPTSPPKQATTAAQPTAAPKAAEQVELRIAWWGSQDRHDRTIKVIDLFQKKYPNIKITYEFAGWADYWTKMTTQASGGNLPDIMQQDYAYITEWSSRNLILPLDELVKSGALNMSDVSQELLQPGVVNGKLVAINLGANSLCWMLDLDAFQKAGVAVPSPKWTWADFEATAMALHDKLGIWGHGLDLLNEQLWGSVYLSTGKWRYNDTGTELGYSDDKPHLDYLNMYLRLQKAKAIPSRAEELSTYAGKSIEARPIVERKSAMDYMWSNQIVAVWKAAGEDRNLKVLPFPRVAGGKSANYIKASMFWSITTHSKHPKEAALFIDFFTNSVEANEILMAERGVPVAAKVREALKPKLGKAQVAMFDYIAELSKDVQPCPPPDPPGHTDIINNIWWPQVMDPIAYGQLTPEKGVVILRQEANAILAKNKK